jgi:small-conductance mechanosensitive channel
MPSAVHILMAIPNEHCTWAIIEFMLKEELHPGSVPRTRSRSIIILAGLYLLQSLVLLGFGIYLVQTSGWEQQVTFARAFKFMPFAMVDSMVSGVVTVCLALLGVIIALALLGMRSWAWLAAICLQGVGLASALYAFFRDRPNYFGMLIGILLVLYLNQHEVRAAFRGRSTT